LARPGGAGLCDPDGPKVDRRAMQLFRFSILFLFVLLAEIAGERAFAISTSNLAG
jgi:hypothetical protein